MRKGCDPLNENSTGTHHDADILSPCVSFPRRPPAIKLARIDDAYQPPAVSTAAASPAPAAVAEQPVVLDLTLADDEADDEVWDVDLIEAGDPRLTMAPRTLVEKFCAALSITNVGVSKNEELCIKNEEICVKNGEI